MGLSSDLIAQFIKTTRDDSKKSNEESVYGIVSEQNGEMYVKLDGSDVFTPVVSTVKMKDGDRVVVRVKDHTATVTGNITNQSAGSKEVEVIEGNVGTLLEVDEVIVGYLGADYAKIKELVANNITVDTLIAASINAAKAEIDELYAKSAEVEELVAERIETAFLEADYATFDELTALEGNFNNLLANYATIESLDATYATIESLDAEKARIDELEATSITADSVVVKNLQAEIADIDTLIFGSASGESISASFANAVIAQLGNAQIKSAMIESVTASKITAGDINTNVVRVVSEDGNLIISDETIQISDATRVRVQIGKDATGDYSINVWDADGKLMFSEGGITDSAIKDAIIRNDMVSENANISASKLDISSLFEEINGSTETIKSTRIYLDDKKQSLDVAFTSLSTDVTDLGETVSSQGTQLSVIQGQISSKVWKQDIDSVETELDGRIDDLSTQYSALEQDVDGISATVASHTTQISNKADSSTVATINNKVSALEINLDGLSSTVSSTYATKESVNDLETTVDQIETRVEQTASSISSRVTATEKILDEMEVGGVNLLRNTGAFSDVPSTEAGYMSSTSSTVIEETFNDLTVRFFDKTADTSGYETFAEWSNLTPVQLGQVYTFSFYAKGTGSVQCFFHGLSGYVMIASTISSQGVEGTSGDGAATITLSDKWERYFVTWTLAESGDISITKKVLIRLHYGNAAYVCGAKLELGNVATDWSPSPADLSDGIVSAQETADEASGAANDAAERSSRNETLIQQLSDCISMLVTDGNGTSLMTQTAKGWTFSTASLENAMGGLSDSLDDLNQQHEEVSGTVDALNEMVQDLAETMEYVRIGVYEDEPCIELGESDSDFKLLITNTRILFQEGSDTPAWITNQSLHIKKAVVEEEMAFGQFVWQNRANGNMGLIWKDEIVEEVAE